ncbi:ABC transporter ATP-binding protein [Zoogloea sp. 1C4]|uniref:ABC transporter ATP-binding protein n=1 Tax=Zoogloea sp. 1C4 TaxID=2570190 RepID=UPI001290AA68|nr:ABC transporter ATP-binding protein [Zoogloea sp. 1C4]
MLNRTRTETSTTANLLEPVVEVSHLSRAVTSDDGARLSILDDVSFTIAAGEAIAIVGASGSGKSTLLGLLAGLDSPSGGSVRIRGQDLFVLDEDGRAELRGACVGFVFQSFQLLPALTALENVMLPLELAGRRDARQEAESWLGRVGLSGRLGHYPRQLSGGEQQRVAVARAFAPRPALVLADEPTGNLDVATGEAVIELMFSLNAESGTTLVLVTHDNALAARCSRTLRLAAGRLESSTAAL